MSNTHPVIEEFIEKRGFNLSQLKRGSLSDLPNPDFIPNIIKFEEYLDSIKRWNSKVIIAGDGDFDGVSSSTILYKTLKELDLNVEVDIAKRKDGYGLTKPMIDRIEKRGADSIITTDCGITQDEEIQYAEDKGIEVFVLDHHNRSVSYTHLTLPTTPYV